MVLKPFYMSKFFDVPFVIIWGVHESIVVEALKRKCFFSMDVAIARLHFGQGYCHS